MLFVGLNSMDEDIIKNGDIEVVPVTDAKAAIKFAVAEAVQGYKDLLMDIVKTE